MLSAGVACVCVAMAVAGAWLPGEAAAADRSGTRITGLTVEHRSSPLGVDAAAPRFGWRMVSSIRGQRQTAYQVLVATSRRRLERGSADMWDSGRVRSSDSVAVTYAGEPLQPSTRYFWTVRVWDKNGRRVRRSRPASFETGLMSTDGEANWHGARWISMAGKTPNSPGAPMLRKEAPLAGARVRSARLYVTALGVYDAYVNGERVTVPQGRGRTIELLTPGWTNYDATVNYMTYDVTGLVGRSPRVTLGAVLGNGWYDSRISANSTYYSSEGNPLALKAKLLIRFSDGSTQVVATRPGDGWRATDTGPYVADDIYDGQTYDARKEMPGWAGNGFDDSRWAEVEENDFATRFPDSTVVAYPGETARVMPKWDRHPQSITVATGVTGEDSSANGRGRIVVDRSRSVTDPAKAAEAAVTIKTGETAIFDLGQNMVGVPRYTVSGPAGAEVAFRFGEMLNDDSEGADGPEGSVYRANLRSAEATSTYILGGDAGGETHQDSLSFYGFRYVSVSVATPNTSVTISDLAGKVATSAIRDTGRVSTDDPLVNQLFSNVRWGQRGNYLWVPTDCPQRDERQGWTGDTQVFANTGLYNGDATTFLSHFQSTLIDSQRIYGADGAQFTDTAPGGAFAKPGPIGISGWADAGVVVPWTVWQMSGDTTIVDRSWPAMVRYMDWMYEHTGETFLGPGALYGDWLAFQRTSTQLMSDVYYAYSARLMSDMAAAIGKDAEARRYARLFEKIKKAFVTRYLGAHPATGAPTVRSSLGTTSPIEPLVNFGVSPEMKTEDDTQTALLWVLKLGLYESEQQRRGLVDLLAANIENTAAYRQAHPGTNRASYAPNTLSVGFLGINVLAPVLTEAGRADLAYELLLQDEMPSWLYSVKNGATTIWERWNSYSKEDGFGPVAMNSFNHYAYGAIAEWMYEYMAGIARDRENPGFQHFFLQPHVDPTGRITRVSGSHVSPYGRIASEWSVSGGTLTYEAMVPANTSATLRIPASAPAAVRRGRRALARAAGVTFLGFKDGVASYELEAGTYRVTSSI